MEKLFAGRVSSNILWPILNAKRNIMLHRMLQHILHCYHLVQEIVNQDDVDLQKIDEKENLANPFTKALKIKEFDDFKWKMGIRYCPD